MENVLEEKRTNDEARKLNQDYKLNIEPLKQAREKVFQLANIHLLEFDISDTMKELTSINLKSLQTIEELELTFVHLQNGLKADYKNLPITKLTWLLKTVNPSFQWKPAMMKNFTKNLCILLVNMQLYQAMAYYI